MQKDIKIGLALIALLLFALGGATYWRLFRVHGPAAGFGASHESADETAASPATKAPAVMPARAAIALDPNQRYGEPRVADRSVAEDRANADPPPNSFLPPNDAPRGDDRYDSRGGSADRRSNGHGQDEQDVSSGRGTSPEGPQADNRPANPFRRASAEVPVDEHNRSAPELFSADATGAARAEPPAEAARAARQHAAA